MRSINVRRMSYLPIAALIFTGSSLFLAPSVAAAGPPVAQALIAPGSEQASRLLEEIQAIAGELNRDAGVLESYTRSGLSWQSHAHQLSLARQHINAVGARLEELQTIRDSAEPWQQQAIDKIVPVALEIASRTEDAINHLNENRQHLFAPVYTGHLATIAGNADQMKRSVDVLLELASTQEKLDNLRQKVADIES